MQELLDGIDQSKVDFQQLQDGTRRVVSKGIRMGEFILAIPADLVLGSDDFELSQEEGRVLSNNDKYEYGISTFKLMMHIIHLLQEEGCKKYYYLKSLPLGFNLPIEWADDKLELIRGTDLYKITLEKKKWLQDALKVAKRRRHTNYKELLWAYSVISSRSFPKSRGKVCLWPVLDYLDHDPDSKIEWIITDSEIKFKAMQDVEAGEILYNNYGPKGNENLLNNYGFVLEDNPNDYVKVTLNSKNDDLYEEKIQLLEEDKWLLFRDDDLPVGMIRACRILLCNQSEWSRFDKIGNTEISIRNEVATLMSLIGLLTNKLELYIASQEKVKDSKEQDLLIYINSHVDILEHHIQLCSNKLESVACRADFFSLHHSDLDGEFLNLCLHQDLEELDNDTLLCLCLIHERENSARFSSRLLNLNVVVTDDQEEDNHFINYVLPYFESECINLESLRWASCVLSSHGGYNTDGSFGVWLPINLITTLVARIICHPLDTLKTQIQGGSASGGLTRGFKQLKDQGIGAFYKGLPIASIFSIPGLSTYLFLYDTCKEKLESQCGRQNSVYVHALCGAIAECGSGLFWTPMEVIKNKQQFENLEFKTVVKKVFKKDGLGGFGRGYFLSLGVFIPYSMTYFVLYERLKDLASKNFNGGGNLLFGEYLLCSSLSGAAAAGVSNVVDVVKTRVQITGKRPWLLVKDMIQKEGLKSLKKGLGARILWVTPSVSISMTTYEVLKH